MDSTPLPTDAPDASPIPTGDFSVSARTLGDRSDACVASTNLTAIWGCVSYGHFKGVISGTNESTSIRFEQAPLTGKFIYGDQIPVLRDEEYPLQLVSDNTAPENGPAYFFYTTFDKLVIIPGEDISDPHLSARSMDDSALFQRSSNRSGKVQSQPGDLPWFCWWNTTHIETFIYANKIASEDDMRSNGEDPGGDPGGEVYPSATPIPRESTPTSSAYASSTSMSTMSGEGDLPLPYLRAIKIKELRFSDASSTPPLCQQMQVLDNWELVMKGPQRPISEKDSDSGPGTDDTDIGNHMAKSAKLISRDIESEADQCYCEWIYGN